MNWTNLHGLENIPSPSLLVDPQGVRANLQRMLRIAGSPDRLRPHVKTHKMPAVMELQVQAGIGKCKVATLAEAEMAAAAGAVDVLWSYPPVGPHLNILRGLIDRYPATSFAIAIDHVETLQGVASVFESSGQRLRIFLDVDCGMHRTGVAWGEPMLQLRDVIENQPGLRLAGLHVYDGHLHAPSLETRQQQAREIIGQLRATLAGPGWPSDLTIVAGGSPTFAVWANETDWECSPGTPLLWDIGYGQAYPDLDFQIAAALLTRVISRPGDRRLCFDLGYKAVAAEKPLDQRIWLPAFPEATVVGQSEEHLVIETDRADAVRIGDPFCALPRHICPTVALHDVAHLIEGGTATGETWEVSARRRIAVAG